MTEKPGKKQNPMIERMRQLAEKEAEDGTEPAQSKDPRKPYVPPSRQGVKYANIALDPRAHKQLKMLSLQHDLSIQALGIEALNLLFAKYHKPEIADPQK